MLVHSNLLRRLARPLLPDGWSAGSFQTAGEVDTQRRALETLCKWDFGEQHGQIGGEFGQVCIPDDDGLCGSGLPLALQREELKGDKSDSTKKPDERLCDSSRRLALREMPHPLKDHALVATREESLFTF